MPVVDRIEEQVIRATNLQRVPLSDMPDPIDWIQEHFYIPETGRGMELYPSQVVPLREALAHNGEHFRYSTVCWSAVKKSGKSSIAAAVALWYAFNQPWSSVKVVANDLKQAASRSYEYIVRAIELHQQLDPDPEWGAIKVNKYTITLPNHSVVEAIPQDPAGEAGGGDDFVLYTEVWGWKHDRAKKMWTESTLSPLKFGQSMRWAESYAGYTGESPVLEMLYEQGVTNGRLLDDKWEMYANEAARLFCLWQTRPHLPWQSPEYYAQEASNLLANEFQRIHRNQWVSSVDTFVPPEWWAACLDNNIPPLGATEPIVVAMDAGVTDDSFGLTAVSRHPSDSDHVVVRYARRWLPPKGGKIRYNNPDDLSDRDTPEGELRWLIANYNVVMVAYDPYQLEDMAGRLTQEGLAWFYAFNQGKERMTADSTLRTLIRERRIHHDGNRELTEHVQNAAAKTDGDDSKVRIVKKSPVLKVDLAVATSMAAGQCLRLNL